MYPKKTETDKCARPKDAAYVPGSTDRVARVLHAN